MCTFIDHADVRRSLRRDEARERLRQAIIDGRFAPGDELRDSELDRWLGMSRTPVRQALLDLSDAGLVLTEANRPARVVTRDAAAARDAVATLGILFRGVFRTSMPFDDAARSSALALIDESLQRMTRRDPVEIRQHSFTKYHEWAELSRNRLLACRLHAAADGLVFQVGFDSAAIEQAPWDQLAAQARELRVAIEHGRVADAVRIVEHGHGLWETWAAPIAATATPIATAAAPITAVSSRTRR